MCMFVYYGLFWKQDEEKKEGRGDVKEGMRGGGIREGGGQEKIDEEKIEFRGRIGWGVGTCSTMVELGTVMQVLIFLSQSNVTIVVRGRYRFVPVL